MFDVIIIGGGPAGVAAGVYAARKRLKTLLIAETIGGQSMDSTEIQNWIGTVKLTGIALADTFRTHLKAYADAVVEVKENERVEMLSKTEKGFEVRTKKGAYEARAVLIATGGSRRKLDAANAEKFENKGLTYCASCDGPLFAGQDVAVVGGGNAGFETAAQLLAYAKSVTLIHRHGHFDKADAATVLAVQAHPNFKALMSSTPVEVKGGPFVSSLVVKNTATGETQELPVTGVFVEIGMLPSTSFAKELVALDEHNRIKVDAKNQRTNVEGVWAAGDCTDELYHQNNIAAGDGVKALEDLYLWLKSR
jgi:alkyl hydroperoxide reductase subunit F